MATRKTAKTRPAKRSRRPKRAPAAKALQSSTAHRRTAKPEGVFSSLLTIRRGRQSLSRPSKPTACLSHAGGALDGVYELWASVGVGRYRVVRTAIPCAHALKWSKGTGHQPGRFSGSFGLLGSGLSALELLELIPTFPLPPKPGFPCEADHSPSSPQTRRLLLPVEAGDGPKATPEHPRPSFDAKDCCL